MYVFIFLFYKKYEDYTQNMKSCLIYFQVALDRLAEAVQVSIAVKCMYGSKPYLFSQMEILPHNPLLTLILKSLKAQSL